ncbi:hypothetical protein NE237_023873 [Protea cynaroides]|uniref:Uncharacterized protein n=1 Tax=Protea cynaroides TaxID=273540 RepID=A0A9Q0K4V8_9MAGN|nr:hypothetical protein NE237_023873 [Protea cynaroides]
MEYGDSQEVDDDSVNASILMNSSLLVSKETDAPLTTATGRAMTGSPRMAKVSSLLSEGSWIFLAHMGTGFSKEFGTTLALLTEFIRPALTKSSGATLLLSNSP